MTLLRESLCDLLSEIFLPSGQAPPLTLPALQAAPLFANVVLSEALEEELLQVGGM